MEKFMLIEIPQKTNAFQQNNNILLDDKAELIQSHNWKYLQMTLNVLMAAL